jgi:hypothetical protein
MGFLTGTGIRCAPEPYGVHFDAARCHASVLLRV